MLFLWIIFILCRIENDKIGKRGVEEIRLGYKVYGNCCLRVVDIVFFKMVEKDGYEGYDIFSVFIVLLIWN